MHRARQWRQPLEDGQENAVKTPCQWCWNKKTGEGKCTSHADEKGRGVFGGKGGIFSSAIACPEAKWWATKRANGKAWEDEKAIDAPDVLQGKCPVVGNKDDLLRWLQREADKREADQIEADKREADKLAFNAATAKYTTELKRLKGLLTQAVASTRKVMDALKIEDDDAGEIEAAQGQIATLEAALADYNTHVETEASIYKAYGKVKFRSNGGGSQEATAVLNDARAKLWAAVEGYQTVRPFLDGASNFFKQDRKTPNREMTALEVKAVIAYARIRNLPVQVEFNNMGLDSVPLTLYVGPNDSPMSQLSEAATSLTNVPSGVETDELFQMTYEENVGVYYDNVHANAFPKTKRFVSGTQVPAQLGPHTSTQHAPRQPPLVAVHVHYDRSSEQAHGGEQRRRGREPAPGRDEFRDGFGQPVGRLINYLSHQLLWR